MRMPVQGVEAAPSLFALTTFSTNSALIRGRRGSIMVSGRL